MTDELADSFQQFKVYKSPSVDNYGGKKNSHDFSNSTSCNIRLVKWWKPFDDYRGKKKKVFINNLDMPRVGDLLYWKTYANNMQNNRIMIDHWSLYIFNHQT